MPSFCYLPRNELRKYKNVLKFSKKGDGNCGYYVLFKAFIFLGKNLIDKKLHKLAPNKSSAKSKIKELLKFGRDNVTHFVQHQGNSVPPKLIQILPNGNSHLFGLHHPNLCTDQDKIEAFMKTIGNSVYTEEFECQDGEKIDKKIFGGFINITSCCIQVQNQHHFVQCQCHNDK